MVCSKKPVRYHVRGSLQCVIKSETAWPGQIHRLSDTPYLANASFRASTQKLASMLLESLKDRTFRLYQSMIAARSCVLGSSCWYWAPDRLEPASSSASGGALDVGRIGGHAASYDGPSVANHTRVFPETARNVLVYDSREAQILGTFSDWLVVKA